jgi:septum site-determining protein MinD
MTEAGGEGFVFAVASGKGGVGKSTTTANLGVALADDGFDVAVVDVDLGMANLAGLLGVDEDVTLHDVLAGDASPSEATYDAHGVTLVPGSTDLEQFAEADAKALHRVVTHLRADHDVVLLDAGAGLSYDIAMAMSVADGVLLVTTAELNSLTDATKTGKLVSKLEKPVVGAVFTRTGDGGFDDVEGIAAALGTTDAVTVSVPHDDAVKLAVRKSHPVVDLKPESPAASAYDRLAASLADSVGMEPSTPATDEEATEEDAFEWVDPDTGEADEAPEPEPADEEPPADGPVYEISIEELMAEAGVDSDDEAAERRVKLFDRVKSKFS